MKTDQLILEAEVVEKTTLAASNVGVAFDHANTVKMQPARVETPNHNADHGTPLVEFLKPSVSNLFLLSCLLGLFVLYCCSCVIHALSFPVRRKSSS